MTKFAYKKSLLALALIWGAPPLTAYTQESSDTVCYTPVRGSDAGKELCMSAQHYSARNNGKTPPANYYLKKKADVAEHSNLASSAPGEPLVNVTEATPAAPAPAAPAPRIAATVESAPAPATPSTRYVLKRPNLDTKVGGALDPALTEPDRLATEAVKLMWEHKLKEASAKINAALLIHYAGNDDRINSGWPKYEAALKAAGKTYQAHTYAGTEHGFNNDTTPRFNAEAAKLAWSRTTTFFKQRLG